MVWNKITKLFRKMTPEQAAILKEFEAFALCPLRVSFPKRARIEALINKRSCLGLDQWLLFLLDDERESVQTHFKLGLDKSSETPAKVGEYKVSAALVAAFDGAIKAAKGYELPWLEGDHAIAAVLEAYSAKSLPDGHPSIPDPKHLGAAALFFRARGLRFIAPDKALAILEDNHKSLKGIESLLPVADLKGSLLACRAFLAGERDPKVLSKDLDKALKAYQQAVEMGISDVESLQVERERLFHRLVRGQAELAAKDIDRLQSAFEDHLTWEQSEEERGRVDLVKTQSGSEEGRVLWLGTRIHWTLMREWARRYDNEEAESKHADGFWQRAIDSRKTAEELCVEAAGIDKSCAWPLYQHSQLRAYNSDLVLHGTDFPKAEVLKILDAAIERQKSCWILHQEKARVLLKDPEDGELVPLAGDDAAAALKTFKDVVNLGQALGALQGGGLALDRASRTEGDLQSQSLASAVELFQTLMRLRETSIDAYRGLAFAFLEQDKGKDALEVVEKGLKKIPESVDLKVLAARIYLTEKREADAKRLIDEILEADPENPEALLLSANDPFGESDG
jgi:hypothetical protein